MLDGVTGLAGAGTVNALLWDRNTGEDTGVFIVIWTSLAAIALLPMVAGFGGRWHETQTDDSKVGVRLP